MTPTSTESPIAVFATPKRDFRREVTDNIIAMLEKGAAPSQKPWNPGNATLEMPHNPTTAEPYRGGKSQ